MRGYIENDDTYIRGTISVPVEPVILPCEECSSEIYPNYRYDLEGITGILCKECLDKEMSNVSEVILYGENWD